MDGLPPGFLGGIMPTPTPALEIVERAWRDAPPAREAAAVNELLRALRELLTPRVSPR
jgi:hypothetical protein